MTSLVYIEIPESAIVASDPIPKHLAATHRSDPLDQMPWQIPMIIGILTKGMLTVVVYRSVCQCIGCRYGSPCSFLLCGLVPKPKPKSWHRELWWRTCGHSTSQLTSLSPSSAFLRKAQTYRTSSIAWSVVALACITSVAGVNCLDASVDRLIVNVAANNSTAIRAFQPFSTA